MSSSSSPPTPPSIHVTYQSQRYSITRFAKSHPGGNMFSLLHNHDITQQFDATHPHSKRARIWLCSTPRSTPTGTGTSTPAPVPSSKHNMKTSTQTSTQTSPTKTKTPKIDPDIDWLPDPTLVWKEQVGDTTTTITTSSSSSSTPTHVASTHDISTPTQSPFASAISALEREATLQGWDARTHSQWYVSMLPFVPFVVFLLLVSCISMLFPSMNIWNIILSSYPTCSVFVILLTNQLVWLMHDLGHDSITSDDPTPYITAISIIAFGYDFEHAVKQHKHHHAHANITTYDLATDTGPFIFNHVQQQEKLKQQQQQQQPQQQQQQSFITRYCQAYLWWFVITLIYPIQFIDSWIYLGSTWVYVMKYVNNIIHNNNNNNNNKDDVSTSFDVTGRRMDLGVSRRMVVMMLMVLRWYVVLTCFSFYTNLWYVICVFMGFGICSIFASLNHYHLEMCTPDDIMNDSTSTHFIDRVLLVTQNISCHWFLGTYLGGSLHLHIEHHLFPHIHRYYYSQLTPYIKEAARQYGLVYHENTIGEIMNAQYHALKQMSQTQIQTQANTFDSTSTSTSETSTSQTETTITTINNNLQVETETDSCTESNTDTDTILSSISSLFDDEFQSMSDSDSCRLRSRPPLHPHLAKRLSVSWSLLHS